MVAGAETAQHMAEFVGYLVGILAPEAIARIELNDDFTAKVTLKESDGTGVITTDLDHLFFLQVSKVPMY